MGITYVHEVLHSSVGVIVARFQSSHNLRPFEAHLLHILDALGVDRCAYVGHSVSAMIGILASIRRRELFTKLILIGASPR